MVQQELHVVTATILNGQSLSAAVDLQRETLVGLQFPAAWTAAGVTFQVSADNVTFNDLYDEFSEVNLASAAAARYLILSPGKYIGFRYVKVRSGTSGAPVTQGGDRAITLVKRGI